MIRSNSRHYVCTEMAPFCLKEHQKDYWTNLKPVDIIAEPFKYLTVRKGKKFKRKLRQAERNVTQTINRQFKFLRDSINKQNALLSSGMADLQGLRDDVNSLEKVANSVPRDECFWGKRRLCCRDVLDCWNFSRTHITPHNKCCACGANKHLKWKMSKSWKTKLSSSFVEQRQLSFGVYCGMAVRKQITLTHNVYIYIYTHQTRDFRFSR